MPTESACPICTNTIAKSAPGVKVMLEHRKSARTGWSRYRLYDRIVCSNCAVTLNAQSADRLLQIRGREFIENFTPADCRTCSLPLLLRPDKRRKVTYCSGSCRAKYYASRKPVEPAVTLECDGCGQPMQGRADRKYCSPACRQRAYRSS